ncbi:MAG: MerC domain-containing protein [Pseudomonadota bacterium]
MIARAYHPAWDRAGFWTSALCLFHCLATPLVMALMPVAGSELWTGEWVHRALGGVLVLLAAGAFVPGFLRHRRHFVPALGTSGLAVVLFAAWIGEASLGETGEILVTVAGSAMLMAAHLANRTFCRSCAVCQAARGQE